MPIPMNEKNSAEELGGLWKRPPKEEVKTAIVGSKNKFHFIANKVPDVKFKVEKNVHYKDHYKKYDSRISNQEPKIKPLITRGTTQNLGIGATGALTTEERLKRIGMARF